MRLLLVSVFAFSFCSYAFADQESIGPDGIKSKATGLTGAGVLIGQVEPGRPGQPSVDDDMYTHEQTQPFAVYAGNGLDNPDSGLVQGAIGAHATEVAGVMIAKPPHRRPANAVAAGQRPAGAALAAGAMLSR